MSRADRLAVYLEEIETDPAFWRRSNCLLFLARWVAIEREYEASRWIGAVSSALQAARLLRLEGGADAFVARQAGIAGLSPIAPSDAALGDIGLIGVPRRRAPLVLGCIRLDGRWAIRSSDGCLTVQDRALVVTPHLAWSV